MPNVLPTFASLWLLLFSASSFAIQPGPDPDPEPTPDPPAGQHCSNNNNQLRAGEFQRSINVGGVRRNYILNVPRSYDGSKDMPLVLDFHPLTSSSDYQLNNSGTNALSESEGFIVAYPDGIDDSWNFGPCCTESRSVDDEGFARAIVTQLQSQGCIDENRVYAMGYSNGGGLSHYLACDASDVFAAVAPAAFDLVEERQCNPSRPISVFLTRGRWDFIVPYRGGESTPPTSYDLNPIHFLGAEGTFEEWARINQCSGRPTSIGNSCQAYQNCAAGVQVVLCTAGGHDGWDADSAWEFLKGEQRP